MYVCPITAEVNVNMYDVHAVCAPQQTSFEMTFVAKGYSNATAALPAPAEGGDLSSAEAGSTESSGPVGEPDMSIVTKVKGPEPGEFCVQREVALASLSTCASTYYCPSS